MALQLCRIISTNCFHIGFNNCSRIAPAMFRFRMIQNLPYSCFSHSPNCSVMRLGREVLIRTSNLLHAACYNRYYVTFCLNKHRRNSFISLFRQNYCFGSVMVGGNGYTTNYPASERLSKRLFSSVQHQFQPSAKANRSGKDANGDENGKSAAQKSLPKKKKKKKNKPLPVIHEITRQLDSEVIGHTVTKSAGADEINKKVLKDCRKKKGNELQPSSKAYMVSKNAIDRDTKYKPQMLHAKKKNKSLPDVDEITELQGTGIISHTITRSSKAIANKKKAPKVGQKKKGKKIQMPSIVSTIGKDAINGNRNQMLHAKKKNNPLPAVDEITELLDTKAVSHTVTSPEEAISCEKKVSKDDDIKKVITGGSVKVKGAKALTIENGKLNSMKHEGISESHSFLASPKSNDLKQGSMKKKAGITGGFQVLQNKSTVTVTGVKNWNKKSRPLYPPSGKSVVVVESITKARVIQNYLGPSYEVLASYGHVRDLARRSGSVRPDDDFSLVWEVPSSAWTHLKSIKMSLNSAENLILASDPDREGEAIAWHIIEMLQQQDALNENIRVARVVFHEITESSIKGALQTPREINSNLVNAYLARRALDYLIGFNISPLLWRKLPGCSSAGRVQSAALALICDRETEIDQSKSREYWTVRAEFFGSFPDTLDRSTISSNLTYFNSKRLGRFSIISKQNAEAIQKKVISLKYDVIDVRRNKSQRKPPMPYITSTLQQDSANKLNFTSAHTMRLAQQLYEGVNLSGKEATGLITYMRTDGMHISNEAAKDINSFVGERYGGEFSSKDIRKYFKKVKNAQEAHEAIRPTNIRRLPSSLAGILDEDSLKLYGLIWSRTIACQMEPALIDTISVDIGNVGGDVVFRTVGSRIDFQGYKAAYKDRDAVIDSISHDEEDDSNVSVFLALHGLKVKDSISLVKVDISQHFTKPPSRYSEGALVKKLEELGIGRPSTYASIMKVLQDRSYVTMKNRVLHPEFRGRMVSEFLSHHFSEVANYSFTAAMETELDNISVGVTEWKCLLRDYWSRFIERCNLASQVGINQVEKMMEEKFGHVVFSLLPNDNRLCPSCGEGTMKFKVSRYGTGYFIGCDQYPQCRYIAGTIGNSEEECVAPDDKLESFAPKLLGCHPKSNEKIYLKKGPYGFYVQLGDGRIGCSAKKCSVIEGTDTDSFALEDALDLLKYPITLGKHPDDGTLVILRQSKQGFSIKHKGSVCPVHKSVKPKTITLEMGLKLLKSKKTKKLGRPKGKLKNYADEVKEETALVG